MTATIELPASCRPWLTIAQEVLDGDYDEADDSTREAIRIGLGRIPADKCRDAMARLADPKKRRERKTTAPRSGGTAKVVKAKDGGWF